MRGLAGGRDVCRASPAAPLRMCIRSKVEENDLPEVKSGRATSVTGSLLTQARGQVPAEHQPAGPGDKRTASPL